MPVDENKVLEFVPRPKTTHEKIIDSIECDNYVCLWVDSAGHVNWQLGKISNQDLVYMEKILNVIIVNRMSSELIQS